MSVLHSSLTFQTRKLQIRKKIKVQNFKPWNSVRVTSWSVMQVNQKSLVMMVCCSISLGRTDEGACWYRNSCRHMNLLFFVCVCVLCVCIENFVTILFQSNSRVFYFSFSTKASPLIFWFWYNMVRFLIFLNSCRLLLYYVRYIHYSWIEHKEKSEFSFCPPIYVLIFI